VKALQQDKARLEAAVKSMVPSADHPKLLDEEGKIVEEDAIKSLISGVDGTDLVHQLNILKEEREHMKEKLLHYAELENK